jgi:hypothetical protein
VRGIEGQSRSMPFNASGVRSEYPHGGRIQALGRRRHRRPPCSFGICCGLSRFAPRNVPLHPALPPPALPRTAPPLGGRGSRRAVPLPQPNSVTSVASVVKKRIPRLSRSFALPRSARLSRFAPRNVPLHPALPPPAIPPNRPTPGRARLPPSHPAAAAHLCGLWDLCG